MRKFTNKQVAKIEQWLDEAFNDGYKAAELDAKYLSATKDPLNLVTLDPPPHEWMGLDRRTCQNCGVTVRQDGRVYPENYSVLSGPQPYPPALCGSEPNLFAAEANMKRAEAEFNKREEAKVPEEWKAQSDGALEAKAAREAEFNKREPIGFDEHGQSWYLEAEQEQLGKTSVIVFADYGAPDELYKSEDMTDELYSFWGEQ